MAKIMVSIPQPFLQEVDRAARAEGRTRSELIREALRRMLRQGQRGRLMWQEALLPLRRLDKSWVGHWDSTDVVREMRDARSGATSRR